MSFSARDPNKDPPNLPSQPAQQSASSANTTAPPPPRKRKQGVSCLTCKFRRVKCDLFDRIAAQGNSGEGPGSGSAECGEGGGTIITPVPCTNCEERGIVCTRAESKGDIKKGRQREADTAPHKVERAGGMMRGIASGSRKGSASGEDRIQQQKGNGKRRISDFHEPGIQAYGFVPSSDSAWALDLSPGESAMYQPWDQQHTQYAKDTNQHLLLVPSSFEGQPASFPIPTSNNLNQSRRPSSETALPLLQMPAISQTPSSISKHPSDEGIHDYPASTSDQPPPAKKFRKGKRVALAMKMVEERLEEEVAGVGMETVIAPEQSIRKSAGLGAGAGAFASRADSTKESSGNTAVPVSSSMIQGIAMEPTVGDRHANTRTVPPVPGPSTYYQSPLPLQQVQEVFPENLYPTSNPNPSNAFNWIPSDIQPAASTLNDDSDFSSFSPRLARELTPGEVEAVEAMSIAAGRRAYPSQDLEKGGNEGISDRLYAQIVGSDMEHENEILMLNQPQSKWIGSVSSAGIWKGSQESASNSHSIANRPRLYQPGQKSNTLTPEEIQQLFAAIEAHEAAKPTLHDSHDDKDAHNSDTQNQTLMDVSSLPANPMMEQMGRYRLPRGGGVEQFSKQDVLDFMAQMHPEWASLNSEVGNLMPMITGMQDNLTREILGKELCRHLINVAFAAVHSNLPAIDPDDFQRDFDAANQDPSMMDSAGEALCSSLAAWGARFSADPVVLGLGRGSAPLGGSLSPFILIEGGPERLLWGQAREPVCRALYQRSRRLLDDSGVTKVPSMTGIQAMLLVGAIIRPVQPDGTMDQQLHLDMIMLDAIIAEQVKLLGLFKAVEYGKDRPIDECMLDLRNHRLLWSVWIRDAFHVAARRSTPRFEQDDLLETNLAEEYDFARVLQGSGKVSDPNPANSWKLFMALYAEQGRLSRLMTRDVLMRLSQPRKQPLDDFLEKVRKHLEALDVVTGVFDIVLTAIIPGLQAGATGKGGFAVNGFSPLLWAMNVKLSFRVMERMLCEAVEERHAFEWRAGGTAGAAHVSPFDSPDDSNEYQAYRTDLSIALSKARFRHLQALLETVVMVRTVLHTGLVQTSNGVIELIEDNTSTLAAHPTIEQGFPLDPAGDHFTWPKKMEYMRDSLEALYQRGWAYPQMGPLIDRVHILMIESKPEGMIPFKSYLANVRSHLPGRICPLLQAIPFAPQRDVLPDPSQERQEVPMIYRSVLASMPAETTV